MRFDLASKEQEIIVYFDSWDKFAAAIEQLCIAEPNKFRFVIKKNTGQNVRKILGRETEHCFNEACSRQITVNIPFLLIIAHKSQRSSSKFV